MRVIEVLLYYVRRGADIIRLDAVTYLWAELGTSCAHLEQTHLIIQLFRLLLDTVAPQVTLVTETNVPHRENIQYFGDGSNEAQMVYNFALPPLVIHAFYTGNCRALSRWASELEFVSETSTYFNFLDSHDGIGLLPVIDLLPKEDIDFMLDKCREHNGMISYRTDHTGEKTPYEMNIAWFSALNNENNDENQDIQIDRFIASRSIALVLQGVPGIYLPSLIGSKNDIESVTRTGEARSINRRTFDAELLLEKLEDSRSLSSRLLLRLGVLFSVRVHSPAFHPNGPQKVLPCNDSIFAVVRTAPDGSQTILTMTNVTDQVCEFVLKKDDFERWPQKFENLFIGRERLVKGDSITFKLQPYQVKWMLAHYD
jgi:sucrose phosphorylase